MTERTARKTVFLDRDGTINVPTGRPSTYVASWEDFEFLPGALEAIALLTAKGYRVCVVTNQRGVSRGVLDAGELARIHSNMMRAVERAGGRVEGVYVCPHEGGCGCRKPEAGLFEQAGRDAPVDKGRSYMVGDARTDMQAALRYGVAPIFLGEDPPEEASESFESLLEAARWIAESEEAR